jgi:hypothetical protein
VAGSCDHSNELHISLKAGNSLTSELLSASQERLCFDYPSSFSLQLSQLRKLFTVFVLSIAATMESLVTVGACAQTLSQQ